VKGWFFWGILLTASVAAKPYQPKVLHSETPQPVILPTVAPPAEMKEGPVTLAEALRLAFIYQSSLRSAKAQVQAAEGRRIQSGAPLNPRLSLSSTYQEVLYNSLASQEGGFGNFIAGGGWTHSASLNQLIYDFGYARNNLRAQEELQRSAQASFEQAQSDLVLQVKQAYYALLQSQRLVAVQEENIRNRREHVAQATSRFQAGLGLPSEVTRSEAALSAALFQLSQAQTKAATDKVALSLVLGLDPRVPLNIAESSEDELTFVEASQLFDKALQQRRELTQFQSNLTAAEHSLEAAHNFNSPTVSTSLSYQNRAVPAIQTIGLNLAINFNLLDGGAEAGRVKEAEGNLERARADLETARQRVLSQVSQAYLNWKNSQQQVLAALAEEANSKESARLADGRYKVGLGTFLDVLDAQTAFLTAQINRVNAQTSVDLSKAALARAIGEVPLALLPDPAAPQTPKPQATPEP
jgi:outer membrane protein